MNYSEKLYHLVRNYAKESNQGAFTLDFQNAEHYDCACSKFGGEDVLKTKFPAHYSAMENSRKANQLDDRNDSSMIGFVDYIDINSLNYSNESKELSTYSYLNLKGKAQTVQLWLAVYKDEKMIASYSDFLFDVDDANLNTLEQLNLDAEKDNLLLIFHATWTNSDNMSNSMICYQSDIQDYFTLSEVVQEITVIDPQKKSADPSKPIYVSYNRDAFIKEEIDYTYKESRTKDKNQEVYLDLKGEVVLNDGVKFIKGLPNKTRIVLNHTSGTIWYNNSIPDTAIVEVDGSNGGAFKWDIDYNWNNFIPASVQAGSRDYMFSMFLSFLAKENEGSENEYSIRIESMVINSSSNVQKINPIHLLWGCIAEDSEVVMDDGTLKRIQHIVVGDKIKAHNGCSQEIVNIWNGTEDTLWNIVTENNKSIKLTVTHPVMTEQGVRSVLELCCGDKIETADGEYEVIKYLYDEANSRPVYNINMNEAGFFFCNGLVVGDNEMENQKSQPRVAAPINGTINSALYAELIEMKQIYQKNNF